MASKTHKHADACRRTQTHADARRHAPDPSCSSMWRLARAMEASRSSSSLRDRKCGVYKRGGGRSESVVAAVVCAALCWTIFDSDQTSSLSPSLPPPPSLPSSESLSLSRPLPPNPSQSIPSPKAQARGANNTLCLALVSLLKVQQQLLQLKPLVRSNVLCARKQRTQAWCFGGKPESTLLSFSKGFSLAISLLPTTYRALFHDLVRKRWNLG